MQAPGRDIEIHGTHGILRTPVGYFLCHMGNKGLHNLDAEVHTIPVPCYAKIKHKCTLKMSSEPFFCFFLLWGPNSHSPTPLFRLWCVCVPFFAQMKCEVVYMWSTVANTETGVFLCCKCVMNADEEAD